MRGKGEPALRGRGENGDLYIEMEVEQHDWFERSGADLIMSLPLPYTDLVLGKTITLPHIDGGELKIIIPKMTNSGETIEIRGKGLPRIRGSGRGDVVILVKLQMPKKVNKAEMKQLESTRQSFTDEELQEIIKQDASKRRQ
jgi:molecular chaperone DnaJ